MADDQSQSPLNPQTSTPASDSSLPPSDATVQESSITEEKPVLEESQSTAPSEEPNSTISAQSSSDVIPSAVEGSLADASTDSSSPPSPIPPSSPPDIPQVPPEIPSVTPSEPPEAAKPSEEKATIDIQSPNNQAPKEQPEALNQIPAADTEKSPEDLANFKPEPLEQPQEAPLANQNISDSGQKTFGDLLSSENQTPSIPPIPSSPPAVFPSPSISFGDLIKDLKPEESVVHPPQPIPSEPQVSSTPPSPQPITYNPPPIPPVSSSSPKFSQLDQSDQLVQRRTLANQIRSQKKQKHLDKIMELARNAKSISNTDVQRLLHVSQSTATNYLAELSRKGLLKRQGTRGGAKYTL